MSSVWKPLQTGRRGCESFSRLGRARQQTFFSHFAPRSMNYARVTEWGKPPQYLVGGPSLAKPSLSQLQLKILAVGVPRAVKGRASGKHSSVRGGLPYDPSIDGVGLDEATGNKYYIGPMAAPLFADYANVERRQIIQLSLAADPITVAAMVNPVCSSWLALNVRAIGGCKGRAVFIAGATSESGRHAIRVARELGAIKVVGASRTKETLDKVEGLDERILLTNPLEIPKSVGPVDVVLDFVGGPTSIAIMKTVEVREGLQHISIGSVAGHENLVVPASLLNARPIRIMGSGMGAFTMSEVEREMPGLVNFVEKMKRPTNIVTAALSDIETAWDSAREKERLVLIP